MNVRQRSLARPAIVGVLLAAAVVSAVLVGWRLGDGSLRDWLLSCAGAAELFGVLLVASPELVPLIQALASRVVIAWLSVKALMQQGIDVARRLLNRPRSRTVYAKAGGVTMTGGSASGRVSIDPRRTLEEKVEYLLRRDQVVQDEHEAITLKLRALPERWQADIGAASEALRGEHERTVAELRDRHIQERLLGIALLLVGIVLATVGNLV